MGCGSPSELFLEVILRTDPEPVDRIPYQETCRAVVVADANLTDALVGRERLKIEAGSLVVLLPPLMGFAGPLSNRTREAPVVCEKLVRQIGIVLSGLAQVPRSKIFEAHRLRLTTGDLRPRPSYD